MMKKCFTLGLIAFSAFWGTSEAAPEVKQEVVALLKPKLNSDRIEYFFGEYGIDKLDIDSPAFPESRIANLHSIHQGKKIMRTLAIVDFLQPTHKALSGVHSEIKNGKSIGIAFRDQGWAVQKQPIYFGETPLSPALMGWMEESSVASAALHVYRLDVSKGNHQNIPYCTIIEVHSPEYLSKEWLRSLYADQYGEFSGKSKEADAMLARLSALIEDFPEPVGHAAF